MKYLVIIALFVLTVISCKQDPRNDACYDAALAESMKDAVCELTCEGVCACNGVTYCNECEANKAGFEVLTGDTVPCGQNN